MMSGLEVIVWSVVFLASSFLLSGMEAGVLALNPLRIRQLKRAGHKRAELLHGYLEHPEQFFWTILIGNTLANWGAYLLIGWSLLLRHADLGWRSLGLWGLTVFSFYTLGDLLPKSLFRRFPNRLSLSMARFYGFFQWILFPLVWGVHRLSSLLAGGRLRESRLGSLFESREELRRVLHESSAGLSEEERTMIDRVLDLQHLPVHQIMVPWEQVPFLPPDASLAEAKAFGNQHGYTHIFIQDSGNASPLVGLLHLKTLLYQLDLDPQSRVRDHAVPPDFMSHQTSLETALRELRTGGHRLAVVTGPDGKPVGLVTLQAILRVIFGEIQL